MVHVSRSCGFLFSAQTDNPCNLAFQRKSVHGMTNTLPIRTQVSIFELVHEPNLKVLCTILYL